MKKNNKKHNSNKDFYPMALLSMCIGIISVNVILALAINNTDGTILAVNNILPLIAYYFILCSLLFVICSVIAFLLFRFLNKDILKTSIHLLSKKITAKQLISNSKLITPCLQFFLYEILKKNKDITLLSVGDSVSSILFDSYYIRNNCVFYRFSLTTTPPEYDNNQLKKIIQGLINSELENYGIVNLSPTYSSKTMSCYSVYIDSVFYDNTNNNLTFDLLYICSENSAIYFNKAINSKTNAKDNKVVYDDEVW